MKPPQGFESLRIDECLGTTESRWEKEVAEEEGFEPPVALTTPVFKTGAFNRSAIPPLRVALAPTNYIFQLD